MLSDDELFHSSLKQSLRLEEAEFDTGINQPPQSSHNQHNTESHPQYPKRPINVPIRAVLIRFPDHNPHEARVSQSHRQRDPSHEPCEIRQEGKRHRQQKSDGSEKCSVGRSAPSRAPLVILACVPCLHAIKHRHRVDLEGAEATEDDENGCQAEHHVRNVAAVELVEGLEDSA